MIKNKTMLDFSKYSELDKKVTFNNGKSFFLYSKMTKRGIRFFYYASGRMFPISKIEAGIC